MRNAYKILVRKPEGKRPLGRHKCKWENDTRIYLGEIGYKGVDWMHLAQDRDPLACSCEHGSETSGSIKGREFLE
jgi:hypothetical protein